MKLLLDTHILLRWLSAAPQLSEKARHLIAAQENVVFISAVSIWEIRIKEALGKIKIPTDFEEQLNLEPFEKLSVTCSHAHALKKLPLSHRDPFDRMLITQALIEDITLVTHDESVGLYDVPHVVV